MKKLFIILIFFLIISTMGNNNYDVTAMSINSNYDDCELIFENENLNLRNIKLKLALFSNHDSYIKKVYIKYNMKVKDYFDKEYFSFDNTDFNLGIEKIINEYNEVLKDNYVYDETLTDINNIQIEKVILSTNKDILNKFIIKYPKVIINKQ